MRTSSGPIRSVDDVGVTIRVTIKVRVRFRVRIRIRIRFENNKCTQSIYPFFCVCCLLVYLSVRVHV